MKTKARELDVPPKEPKLPWAALPSKTLDTIVRLAKGGWGYWIVDTVDATVWSDGGVGIIGDAAHAMLPFQAQGAAMNAAARLNPHLSLPSRAGVGLSLLRGP